MFFFLLNPAFGQFWYYPHQFCQIASKSFVTVYIWYHVLPNMSYVANPVYSVSKYIYSFVKWNPTQNEMLGTKVWKWLEWIFFHEKFNE